MTGAPAAAGQTPSRTEHKGDPRGRQSVQRGRDLSQRVFTIFKCWNLEHDTSPRLSAVGPVFLLTRTPKGSTVIRIPGEHALTERLVTVLREKLLPGQFVMDVSAYQVARAEGQFSPEWLMAKALWLIQAGKVLKVRQHHQQEMRDTGTYPRRYELVKEYHCHGASMVFPFIEPTEVHGQISA